MSDIADLYQQKEKPKTMWHQILDKAEDGIVDATHGLQAGFPPMDTGNELLAALREDMRLTAIRLHELRLRVSELRKQ